MTQHVLVDAPAVMSATNVTQPVAPVLDTKFMNVSTAGVEPNATLTDVVCVTATLDLKPLETNVNNKVASVKDVTPATRVNVFIANTGITLKVELALNVVRTIAMIIPS